MVKIGLLMLAPLLVAGDDGGEPHFIRIEAGETITFSCDNPHGCVALTEPAFRMLLLEAHRRGQVACSKGSV